VFSRSTELSLGAGAAFVQVRFQDSQPGFYTAAYPVGLAGLQYLRVVDGARTTFRLDFAFSPFIDLRSGVADERAQLTGAFRHPRGRMLYSGLLGGARSVGTPFIRPVTIAQASLEAEYAVSPLVGVGGGVRYAWQSQEGFAPLSFATVFALLTLHAPTARF